jgi:dihydroorotate dehydrogenase electron transfer subunit
MTEEPNQTTAESSTQKGQYKATVIANKQIRQRFNKLRLEFSQEAAKVFSGFMPGQFVQLDVSDIALPPEEDIPNDLHDAADRKILLRRPFSFAGLTSEHNKIQADIIYCVLGPATLRMTTLKPGDSLSIIGPLGNGFHIPANKKIALLVSGGMGIPPIQHLAVVLATKQKDIEVIVFAGAKTARGLPFEGRLDEISVELGFSLPEFAKFGIESLVATDDGSIGYQGLVTGCLSEWLSGDSAGVAAAERSDVDGMIICGCGPEPMLARLAQIARDKNIDCQISMERRMACGIGLCQSCAVECRVDGSSETVYKLCCETGPVFNAKEIVF